MLKPQNYIQIFNESKKETLTKKMKIFKMSIFQMKKYQKDTPLTQKLFSLKREKEHCNDNKHLKREAA